MTTGKHSRKPRSTLTVKASEWKIMPQRTKQALALLGAALMMMSAEQIEELTKKRLAPPRKREVKKRP